ncbi:MAG: hypothetical protein M0P57_13125 [Syntrophales bacterium]|jgi:hypothetical protein|nr:hypothetical protein [Syntrophales bacterium]MDY0044455.1 sugar-transfer associated ATP-grasp domain-containing protein [Syntrophales bacterium]
MHPKYILNKIDASRLAFRLKEIEHRISYAKHDYRMARALDRFNTCTDKKPDRQIRKEMNVCKSYWDCHPLHYYRYDLYRKDRELDEEELLNYIPEFFFYRLFMPFYRSGEYDILLLGDKIITEKLFKGLAIPQAQSIGLLFQNRLFSADFEEIDFTILEEKIREKNYRTIFLKPSGGMAGSGIHIFSRNAGGRYITSNNSILDASFLKAAGTTGDYMLQGGIEQEAEVSTLYPHAVNTFRTVTENKKGDARIVVCMLRLGRGGMKIDNASANGIFVKVDIDTGFLAEYAHSLNGETFDRHPDTQAVFKNRRIVRWHDVKDLAIDSARKLPQFTYIAWDFCLTPEACIALEAHPTMGLDGIQIAHNGLRHYFRIDDPQFYWNHHAGMKKDSVGMRQNTF